jgi:hypothetical protein
VAVVMSCAACGGGLIVGHDGGRVDGGGVDGAGGPDGGGNRWVGTLAPVNRNVDILFVIDDSSSMRLAQDNLLRNFPTFVNRLQDPPGLPNIHLAVVSQDMGAGDGSITGCDATGGKNGIFQYTARGTCTATGLQAGQTYISNVGGVANYSGNIAEVFSCIAALGESGCGFEHQFAATLRALGADGRAAPAENQGFLRPDAALAIIMLTNEDDCSETPGVPLFDTGANTNIASQLGPPANFRCNEFGHLCRVGTGAENHPIRLAPGNDVAQSMSYDTCKSNDQEGYLRGVVDTASKIKALKADPSRIAFATIQGPAAPYSVQWKNPGTTDRSCGATSCPWPVIGHSCVASDTSFADPGVRTQALAQEFGTNGLTLSICDNNLGPVLDRVATSINRLGGPLCLPGIVALDPQTGRPDCKVTERYGTGAGTTVNKAVSACSDNGNVAPCWQLTVAPGCDVAPTIVVSLDPTVPLSSSVTVSYDCAKCTAPDPAKGCP